MLLQGLKLTDIGRIKGMNFQVKNDPNKAGEGVSALAVCRLLLEIERNLNSKIQELLKKNDQLEAELISLHETLESTESELAKVKSEKEVIVRKGFPMKKQIDFDTLCRVCRYGFINCSHKNNENKMKTTVDCPVWNSLPDVPEPDQSKDTERLNTKEQPTWLEYEGY